MEVVGSFGAWLKEARIQTRASLRSLATHLDIAPSYLSDIENDRRIPAEELMRRITEALGLDYDEAMARAGRFGEDVERELKQQPEAVKLVRRIAAAKMTDEELRQLIDAVEKRTFLTDKSDQDAS